MSTTSVPVFLMHFNASTTVILPQLSAQVIQVNPNLGSTRVNKRTCHLNDKGDHQQDLHVISVVVLKSMCSQALHAAWHSNRQDGEETSLQPAGT
eukprot:5895754-Amphidinium_carterae.1